MVRLELMRLNTAPALDPALLADVSSLSSRSSAELRDLGRLPDPMIKRKGDRGFRVITWDEAEERIAAALRAVVTLRSEETAETAKTAEKKAEKNDLSASSRRRAAHSTDVSRRRRSDPATSRCTGRKGMRCCPRRPLIPHQWSATTTPR
jgi:hypothetical protein